MKLAAWRQANNRTQGWLALNLGCSQSHVSQIERARDPLLPGRDLMRSIYVLTSGKVQPNDFYDVPTWEAASIMAEAEALLRRSAA